ncbi:MAG: hypothetical protein K0R58_3407, partial [Ramlibacter sp.]|nr:hypothetical protein [Ramlibacter sp.]
MALFSRKETKSTGPLLEVSGLDVYYGRAHALQGVSFTLSEGVLGLVGRNGMGKTTLCNAITGLVPATGSIKLAGEEILGRSPNEITKRGIAYVPQGRRMWPSLTVDETLRLVAKHKREVERVYTMFPRLAERKSNGGAQLSGGEQQMLAIGRALLLEPKVLVMDEPTEGLAPVIVEQVAQALRDLAAETHIGVLLIEQNLGVAMEVADRIGVMVNGRIAHEMAGHELAADKALQERLLGVRSNGEEDEPEEQAPPQDAPVTRVFTVRRAHADADATPLPKAARSLGGITQWPETSFPRRREPRTSQEETGALGPRLRGDDGRGRGDDGNADNVLILPVAATAHRAAYVAGTFDTKGRELSYVKQCLEKRGLRVVTVDLSTSGKPSSANVHPREVARFHPQGESAVFTNDRGSAVTAMALAFERFLLSRRDLGGVLGAGGSGGTTLATQAMRALPIGLPKVMVSTMASGDTRAYVGPSDICMMYSVTDVSGINRISERVLANAANALAGMMAHGAAAGESVTKPALGLTMFGVTTPCVQSVTRLL